MTLSKYDWGAACRFFPGFRDRPGVMRLAWLLCEFYSEDIGCAYPTRETLANLLGAAPESVSKWLRALSAGGAITCVSKGVLPADKQALIGRKSRRAQIYILNFGWALDVLQCRDELVSQKVTSQTPFDSESNQPATPKGNQLVISEGGQPVTLIPYSDTLDHTLKEKKALNGSSFGVSAREGVNAYAKAKGRLHTDT